MQIQLKKSLSVLTNMERDFFYGFFFMWGKGVGVGVGDGWGTGGGGIVLCSPAS